MLTTIPAPATVNDFPVLASYALHDKDGHEPGHAVLCDRGLDHERYVTWVVCTGNGGETWRAFWGHYFDDLESAQSDLASRTGS